MMYIHRLTQITTGLGAIFWTRLQFHGAGSFAAIAAFLAFTLALALALLFILVLVLAMRSSLHQKASCSVRYESTVIPS